MADGTAPERNPAGFSGFRESVAATFGAVAQYLRARLLLVKVEAAEAFSAWLKLVICFVAALILLFFFYIGLVAGIIAWVSTTGFPVHWTILIVALLHLAGAVALVLIGKKKFAVSGFTQTIEELQKDQDWLAAKREKKEAVSGTHG